MKYASHAAMTADMPLLPGRVASLVASIGRLAAPTVAAAPDSRAAAGNKGRAGAHGLEVEGRLRPGGVVRAGRGRLRAAAPAVETALRAAPPLPGSGRVHRGGVSTGSSLGTNPGGWSEKHFWWAAGGAGTGLGNAADGHLASGGADVGRAVRLRRC